MQLEIENCGVTLKQERSQGGAGGARAPHWLVKYAKSHHFGGFEVDFL